MSVTFFPAKSRKEKSLWGASYTQRGSDESLPQHIQDVIASTPHEDLGYHLWGIGLNPLPFWENYIENTLRLKLSYDYKTSRVYTDESGQITLVLDAQDPEENKVAMQLANRNAGILCDLLHIEDVGSMHPVALLKRVEKAKNVSLNDFEVKQEETQRKDPTVPFGLNDGPKMIDMGLSKEQISGYFLRLESLCDYCIQNECSVSWG